MNDAKELSSEAPWELREGDVVDVLRKFPDEKYDLIISSPPYNIGKVYEKDGKRTIDEYIDWQREILKIMLPRLSQSGSICWQVGNYVRDGELFPLDLEFMSLFREFDLKLRNRIIWRFNFGRNAHLRFSGRYETLLWLTTSDKYKFNLDSVRIPQLYPGKRHSSKKGPDKAGLPSGNPLGKNPSDYWEFSAERDFQNNPIWEIPNVKANHPEKTNHPCQFPIELAERCVLAFTEKGDKVLDPFVGTGASVLAAVMHDRQAIGIDRDAGFLSTAKARLAALEAGSLPIRPMGTPIYRPEPGRKVARVPDEWTVEAAE